MNIIEHKKQIINKLKPKLIEAFVKFYGENNRYKIENVINNITIIFVEKNIPIKDIKLERDNLKKEISTEITQALNHNSVSEEELKEIMEFIVFKINNEKKKQPLADELAMLYKKIMKYFYWDLVYSKKINDDDKKIYLGCTEKTIVNETIKNSFENMDDLASAAAYLLHDNFIIGLQDFNISVHSLIHEINHFLGREKLALLIEDNENVIDICNYGINSDLKENDLIYEIFTELEAQDILNLFDKNNIEEFMLDFEMNSGYLQIDRVSSNVVECIYKKMKDIINNSIISGNGPKIKKIIGEVTYNKLNRQLRFNNFHISRFNAITPNATIEKFIEEKAGIPSDNFEECKLEAFKNYEKYLQYNLYFNQEIEHLISEGKAKRVK